MYTPHNVYFSTEGQTGNCGGGSEKRVPSDDGRSLGLRAVESRFGEGELKAAAPNAPIQIGTGHPQLGHRHGSTPSTETEGQVLRQNERTNDGC